MPEHAVTPPRPSSPPPATSGPTPPAPAPGAERRGGRRVLRPGRPRPAAGRLRHRAGARRRGPRGGLRRPRHPRAPDRRASSSTPSPTPAPASPATTTATPTPGSATRPSPRSSAGWPASRAAPRPSWSAAARPRSAWPCCRCCGPGTTCCRPDAVYEGSRGLFLENFARFGIEVDFVDDPADLDAWRALLRPTTRALFARDGEQPDQRRPRRRRGRRRSPTRTACPLVVDSTLTTPYLLRPIEHGADVVVHSASKFLAGHGASLGGAVVVAEHVVTGARPASPTSRSRRRCSAAAAGEQAHGGRAYVAYARAVIASRLGPTISPLNAFLLQQGAADPVAAGRASTARTRSPWPRWLAGRPEVASVDYAGLPGSPSADLAARYLPRGAGSVLCVTLHGGEAAAERFVDSLRLFSRMTHLGDVRSLVLHPGSTTHAHRDPADLAAAGIYPGTVRLSVGTEETEDLLADLERRAGAVGALARPPPSRRHRPAPPRPRPAAAPWSGRPREPAAAPRLVLLQRLPAAGRGAGPSTAGATAGRSRGCTSTASASSSRPASTWWSWRTRSPSATPTPSTCGSAPPTAGPSTTRCCSRPTCSTRPRGSASRPRSTRASPRRTWPPARPRPCTTCPAAGSGSTWSPTSAAPGTSARSRWATTPPTTGPRSGPTWCAGSGTAGARARWSPTRPPAATPTARSIDAFQHRGEHFDVDGPLNAVPFADGDDPVVVSPGGSPRGLAYAGAHSDVQLALAPLDPGQRARLPGEGARRGRRRRPPPAGRQGPVRAQARGRGQPARRPAASSPPRWTPTRTPCSRWPRPGPATWRPTSRGCRWTRRSPRRPSATTSRAGRSGACWARRGSSGWTRCACCWPARRARACSRTGPGWSARPQELADFVEEMGEEADNDGFLLSGDLHPVTVHRMLDDLVPELRRRGVLRDELGDGGLRANLSDF